MMATNEERAQQQPWGATVSGDPIHDETSRGDTGVAGASFAGTPAGPARGGQGESAGGSGSGTGTDDAEAETSGLRDAQTFAEGVTPPPVFDE